MRMKKQWFFGILLSLLMVLSLLPGTSVTAFAAADDTSGETEIVSAHETDESVTEESAALPEDETEVLESAAPKEDETEVLESAASTEEETETSSETQETVSETKKAGALLKSNSKGKAVLKDANVKLGEVKAEAAEHTHDGITFTEWTAEGSLPSEAGNYYLANDVTISSTWTVPAGTTNLCLNGHGIIMSGTNRVITVPSGCTLNLYDCGTAAEHKFTVNNPSPKGAGLAKVNDSLESGYQTFNGGYITGGSAGQGGGVYVNGGTFSMAGGNIIGNRTRNQGYYEGGGVALANSTDSRFVMTGGAIQYNTSVGRGGGLGIEKNATVELSGNARIIYNSSNNNDWGGGISSYGTLNISGNVKVTNNRGESALHPQEGSLNVSGAPVIFDNEVKSGNIHPDIGINVVGKLTEGAKLGVYWNEARVVTNSSEITYNDASKFVSDNSDYSVLKNADGQLCLGVGYTVTFDANGHGTAPDAQALMPGCKVTKPADPTADGYAFDGWYKEETLTNEWDFDNDTVTENVTLYAKWRQEISHTVTFKVVNGSWDDDTTVEKPVTLTGYEGDILKLSEDQIPAAGSKPEATYKAGSWDVTPDTETEITADTTYTYTYEKKASIEPSVSIDDWAYGETAKTPSVTGNTGNGDVTYSYAKKGTEDFSETVPSEVGEYTVKAVVEETSDYLGGEAVADFAISKADPEPAVISTDNMTGDYESISIEGVAGQEYIIVPKGTEVTEDSWKDAYLPDPERDNWVFFDELSAATEYEIYTRVKETDNYKASEPVKAAVNTSTESVGLDFDSDLVGATIKALPDPEKEGYSYKWYRADRSQNEEGAYEDKLTEIEGATGDTYTSTSDDFGKYIIVKVFVGDTEVGDAEFGPIGYGTVTFDSKGGSKVTSVTNLAYNAKVKKPADPVKEGFTFAGWYTDEDYTEAWDFNKDTVMWTETTLYAKWAAVDVVYSNTQGADGEWTKGSNKELQFTFKRSVADSKTISHFTGILVDGKKVDQKNYTAQSGSVIIKLKSAYLETLAAGKHTLTAQFDDGKDVTVNFTIKAKAADTSKTTAATTTKTGSPATGDPVNLQLMFMLMILSIGVIVAVCIRRRKNVK